MEIERILITRGDVHRLAVAAEGVAIEFVRRSEDDCGLELHRSPRDGEMPNHHFCRYMCGTCCHDGSTLIAREQFLPTYRDCVTMGDYEPLWNKLEDWLRKELGE